MNIQKTIMRHIVYYLSNDTKYNEHTISDKRYKTIFLNSAILTAIFITILFKIGEFLIDGRMSNLVTIILNIIVMFSIHIYFRKTDNLNVAVYLTIVFFMLIFIVLNQFTKVHNYSLLWWSIPIPIYVLTQFGLRKTLFVISVFYLYIFGYIAFNVNGIIQSSFGARGLLTYFGVLFITNLLVMNLAKQKADLILILQIRTEALELVLIHDKLTGIYNRTKLDDTLAKEIARTNRDNQPLSVLMLDVDHFKKVNDQFGHLVGDDVLTEIAQVIHKTCRSIDVVGRWGGEEFMVVCPLTTSDGANILANKIIRNIDEHKFSHGLHQTVSIGITQHTSVDTLDTIIMRADKALYKAKINGRNRAETYHSNSNDIPIAVNLD